MSDSPPPKLCLLRLQGLSIYRQLQIEEALLRADDRNWCLLHSGTSPAIVMGISNQRSLLVNEDERRRQNIPVVRRFSGGGTVVVDESTCLISFIFNSNSLDISPFPQSIMQWTADFYRPLFPNLDFQLREHDYAIGEHKCGGNAQYICKDRWLHHTSFLWNYSEERMHVLNLPKHAPVYRQKRPHNAFICRLCDKLPHYRQLHYFLDAIANHLRNYFQVVSTSSSTIKEILSRPHRQAVVLEN